MKFKAHRDCSVLKWRMTTSRIFDLRWEHSLLLTIDHPSDKVLEKIVRLQVARFLTNPDEYGAIQSRNSARRKKRERDDHKLRMCV